MKRKMIFFGAGASFGSDIKDTPPLSCNLYNKLKLYDPLNWNLPSNIVDSFISDFEKGLLLLYEKNPTMISILQRSIASFFFDFEPQQNNLYKKLAKQIYSSNWEGYLATINHDRLLLLSLIQEDLIINIKDFLKIKNNHLIDKKKEIELILPHGSCNLFNESIMESGFGNIKLNGLCVSTRGKINMINDINDFKNRIKNKFPPVMSYFEPQKTTTSGVNFIEKQRERFNQCIMDSEIIGIIGVKVRPSDSHIWDSLSKTEGKLIYCSGERDGTEFHNWGINCRKHNHDKIIHKNFSDGFDEFRESLGIVK